MKPACTPHVCPAVAGCDRALWVRGADSYSDDVAFVAKD